jgi:hypothetical protein
MGDFLAELKRRRVFRASLVYGLVGFTVVQAASAIMPPLGIPPWGLSGNRLGVAGLPDRAGARVGLRPHP